MLSGLLFIELIAHYYADIYDADKRGLILLFLGLEGWDQHCCNPPARLPLPHPAQVLFLAPAGSCRACVGSQSTPLACTSGCTGCVALFFWWKTLSRGVPQLHKKNGISCKNKTTQKCATKFSSSQQQTPPSSISTSILSYWARVLQLE
jgi:hypothetical protein